MKKDDAALRAEKSHYTEDIELLSWCIWRACAPRIPMFEIDHLLYNNRRSFKDGALSEYAARFKW